MKREEEICNFIKDSGICDYKYDELLGYNEYGGGDIMCAFIEGAKWADEHPKSVWNYASKEPQDEYDIMCQDKFGGVWLTDYLEEIAHYKNGWEDYVSRKCIVRWAYVADLLPKGR